MTRGDSTNQIARRLGISAATVATHSNHILRRLGVASRSEAVALAHELLK